MNHEEQLKWFGRPLRCHRDHLGRVHIDHGTTDRSRRPRAATSTHGDRRRQQETGGEPPNWRTTDRRTHLNVDGRTGKSISRAVSACEMLRERSTAAPSSLRLRNNTDCERCTQTPLYYSLAPRPPRAMMGLRNANFLTDRRPSPTAGRRERSRHSACATTTPPWTAKSVLCARDGGCARAALLRPPTLR